MRESSPILYTLTDEAPALATHSLLPIIRAFARPAGVPIELRDISLAGRILAVFSDRLKPEQRVPDVLAELGAMTLRPDANIIKLPNVSASLPQMKACIRELQAKGYALPDYPEEASSPAETETKARYDKVKGSAVNPVLREGNSDRRAPLSVKEHARKNPPRTGAWSRDSKTHVATMGQGDFRGNEKSLTLAKATSARIEFVDRKGSVSVLKDGLKLEEGEVLDASVMSRTALVSFLREQIADAKKEDVLFSLHLKATMMKVSDPILFGHAVRCFFSTVFDKHATTLEALGVDASSGFGDLLGKIAGLPDEKRRSIERDIEADYANGPSLAMVDSDKGITNLHVPSDIIIDASMPPMIRDSGKMWNSDGKLVDCKAVIPDSSYAGIYDAIIEDCRERGALDPATLGSVANVGLMAQKAEEYGSHDKTFEIEAAGKVRVIGGSGELLLEHAVEEGDVWRACQTKAPAIADWVKLAVTRARASASPAIFWLDSSRAHDQQIIRQVETALASQDTKGLEIKILPPAEAMRFSLDCVRRGKDCISVTGNVLRDYLTDLFPILELGTSAKMLSIVPLMNGGGLFETGAGGSAPKHVQQFEKEGHLRWDSLGEFLALSESLTHLGERFNNPGARLLGRTLDAATAKLLEEDRSPSRKVHELDSRGSHYYLALYWAEALATQSEDPALAARFAPVAQALASSEETIIAELDAAQGAAQRLGGYYMPDAALVEKAMRPSATFNSILDSI